MGKFDKQRFLDAGWPFRRRGQAVLTVAVAAVGVYLVAAHWVHVLDALPYLWVVLMMGMHLFMHGGHGGHGGHAGQEGHDGGNAEEGAGHAH